MRKEKGEPMPNRVQSSLLELPRCEGGKDYEVGLKEKDRAVRIVVYLCTLLVYSYLVYSFTKKLINLKYYGN